MSFDLDIRSASIYFQHPWPDFQNSSSSKCLYVLYFNHSFVLGLNQIIGWSFPCQQYAHACIATLVLPSVQNIFCGQNDFIES